MSKVHRDCHQDCRKDSGDGQGVFIHRKTILSLVNTTVKQRHPSSRGFSLLIVLCRIEFCFVGFCK